MSVVSPTNRRRSVTLVLALVLSLVAASCGSSDSDASDSGNVSSSSADSSSADSGNAVSSAADSGNAVSAGSAEDSVAEAGNGVETKVVETELGPVDVPVSIDVIVALDEYAALDLLAVGSTPTVVFGTYQSEVGGVILDDLGIELIPGTFGSYNFEAIASYKPDLIVMTAEAATQDFVEPLNAIAPTIVIPYDAPWREILAFTGEFTNRQEAAASAEAALDGVIKDFAGEFGEGQPSIGVLANTPGFGIFSMSEVSPLSGVLGELGYVRPEAEQGPSEMGSAIMTSEELLQEHDADLLVVLSGAYYDADALTELAVYEAVPAVADGRSFVVDGDVWLGSFPFAVYWVVQDLRAVQGNADPSGIGSVADTIERWSAFQALAE